MSTALFSAALSCCAVAPAVQPVSLRDVRILPELAVLSPQERAVVPGDLREIAVTWTDEPRQTGWTVFLQAGEEIVSVASNERSAVLDMHALRLRAPGDREARLFVCRGREPKVSGCGRPVAFTISSDALGESVRYRLVEPLFNAGQDSAIVQKDVASGDSRRVFETKAVCIGCHAYSSSGLAAFNIRKGKDRRLVILKTDGDGPELFDTRKIGEFAFLSWSPDGRSLAMVVNTFGTIDVKADVIEPFNLLYQTGDIAIYDAATKRIKPLPGASEMDVTEDMPAWSPDGKSLLYVRYRADREQGIASMGIYRVPFNNGQGGTPEPVVVPSREGEYSYFPNYSPDGKWISFVKGNGSRGVFARKTSDLYIMPSSGGPARKLSLNVDGAMDSWHRWSPDGRWLLFSSKQAGDMTALYLSHVDQGGNASPPAMLARHEKMKVNLPEFVHVPAVGSMAGFNELIQEILSDAK